MVKTCEPVAEMRECRIPRDWSLLALQNVRTGKSHYLVICRCPDANILGTYVNAKSGIIVLETQLFEFDCLYVLYASYGSLITSYVVEGPMSHDQPTYASVPGIRVYGMMCVQGNRKGRQLRYTRALSGICSIKISIDDLHRSP